MRSASLKILFLCVLSGVLLSIPWLVPHTGAVALFAFLPLLCADAISDQLKVKRFFLYHYFTFVVWNAITTFWVCNATVGGGIFAVLANAFQMSLVWGIFRFSKKRLPLWLSYVFLAVMWMAWEWRYFYVDISWPWLVLGNAFAGSTHSIQWYEYTGVMGGSLWIWTVNLTLFGLLVAFLDGKLQSWNPSLRAAMIFWTVACIAGPVALSGHIYRNYVQQSEGRVDVVIAQPSIDPYQKFESLSQAEQNERLLDLFARGMEGRDSSASVLLLAPETFTSDIIEGRESATMQSFRQFLSAYPHSKMIFGASSYDISTNRSAPSPLSQSYGNGWITSHNTAVSLDASGAPEFYHKSKLVVAVEMTPYPKVFVPIDRWLSKQMGYASLMGRCVGQDEVSVLHYGDVPVAPVVCYESIYGDYCRGYVNKGAKLVTVITNDSWWGDTPGYRQHLNYSRLRAIELRRDVARCANSGISCFIDQRGDILEKSEWWQPAVMQGKVDLNSKKTFFAEHGDIIGIASAWLFCILLLVLAVRSIWLRVASR